MFSQLEHIQWRPKEQQIVLELKGRTWTDLICVSTLNKQRRERKWGRRNNEKQQVKKKESQNLNKHKSDRNNSNLKISLGHHLRREKGLNLSSLRIQNIHHRKPKRDLEDQYLSGQHKIKQLGIL